MNKEELEKNKEEFEKNIAAKYAAMINTLTTHVERRTKEYAADNFKESYDVQEFYDGFCCGVASIASMIKEASECGNLSETLALFITLGKYKYDNKDNDDGNK